ncbi:hypothetical protein L596_002393 [Steinernema carpocapsae]|uniref:Peptidase M12A domain-containing protein n=1 Tax=Steinernema carpocapsae TaxID=34508 RepID=A0A4U8UP67_STECR|nr:hypothetical protein L596_002393 [Steinernema carpocapsae]
MHFIYDPNKGCSPVSRKLRENRIKLYEGCRTFVTVLHEIAHALELTHTQRRPDRDQYIDNHLPSRGFAY